MNYKQVIGTCFQQSPARNIRRDQNLRVTGQGIRKTRRQSLELRLVGFRVFALTLTAGDGLYALRFQVVGVRKVITRGW